MADGVIDALVPLIMPIFGAAVTLIAARIGLGGWIRKIDLLKTWLELTKALLECEEANEALGKKLLQVNNIIAEMVADFGNLSESHREGREADQSVCKVEWPLACLKPICYDDGFFCLSRRPF